MCRPLLSTKVVGDFDIGRELDTLKIEKRLKKISQSGIQTNSYLTHIFLIQKIVNYIIFFKCGNMSCYRPDYINNVYHTEVIIT